MVQGAFGSAVQSLGRNSLPVFAAGGLTLYRRLTVIVSAGVIERVFYPVTAPGRHPAEVLGWLRTHPRPDPRHLAGNPAGGQ